jgi:hypothetical protein
MRAHDRALSCVQCCVSCPCGHYCPGAAACARTAIAEHHGDSQRCFFVAACAQGTASGRAGRAASATTGHRGARAALPGRRSTAACGCDACGVGRYSGAGASRACARVIGPREHVPARTYARRGRKLHGLPRWQVHRLHRSVSVPPLPRRHVLRRGRCLLLELSGGLLLRLGGGCLHSLPSGHQLLRWRERLCPVPAGDIFDRRGCPLSCVRSGLRVVLRCRLVYAVSRRNSCDGRTLRLPM